MISKALMVVFSALLICTKIAYGAEISLSINGDKFDWTSGSVSSGYLKPSLWDIPSNLPVASKVIPGGPTVNGASSLTLLGNGKNVSVPMSIVGAEYRLSSFNGSESISGSSASTTFNGTLAAVLGAGSGNKVAFLTREESPFTHFRPIFGQIDQASWLNTLRSNNVPQGRYQGNFSISIEYDYYRNGVRIRNHVSSLVRVVVDYVPAMLNNVTVDGDGLIEAVYSGYETVSGQTDYVVTASGVFPNGVLMGLKAPSDGVYFSMKGKTAGEEIRYDLTCIMGCVGQTNLIVNGTPQINTTSNKAKISAQSINSAQARLRVSFKDKPQSEISDGTYNDTFILVFEAAL